MHACVLVLREACFRVARLGLPLKVLAFLLISTRCVDVLNVLHARAVPWLCLPVSVWGLIHCRGSGLRDRICYSSVERFLLFVQPCRQRNRAAYFARLAWSHARKFYKKLAYAGSVFGGGADRVSPSVVILSVSANICRVFLIEHGHVLSFLPSACRVLLIVFRCVDSRRPMMMGACTLWNELECKLMCGASICFRSPANPTGACGCFACSE